MRVRQLSIVTAVVLALMPLDAQSSRTRTAARKAPPAQAMTKVDATLTCPATLGVGVKTRRNFCDVLTGREPNEGVIVTIPPHRGPVTLSFDLHNRHTYSEDLIKAKRAYRQYTATVGVLALDNTLVDRAIVRSEFRTAADLFDRVEGGAGPAGVKAVAPSGAEAVTIELPADIGDEVSILGEHLKVRRPDGDDFFTTPGRPIATISNVTLEYRPAPAPKKAPTKKAPTKKP